jgi:predicted DNA-binding protein with PD1-like motif
VYEIQAASLEMGLKTFALVFDKDDEVRESLLEFANANRLADSQVSAIGAFSEVTLGYFDRDQKNYKKIPVREQVEVLASPATLCRTMADPACTLTSLLAKAMGARTAVICSAGVFGRLSR